MSTPGVLRGSMKSWGRKREPVRPEKRLPPQVYIFPPPLLTACSDPIFTLPPPPLAPFNAGMEIALQLSVFLENKPGTLAAVCETLAEHKVNIYALSISDTTDHSVIRMVLSDPQKALHILGERGVLVVENKVLLIENSNQPGTLAGIAETLAEAKINIEYAYLATSPASETGLAVLRVSDTKKAVKILEGKK